MFCRICKIIAVSLILSFSSQALVFAKVLKADFYVSPTGKDSNPGTVQKPFATLSRARDAVRVLKNTKPGSDISVLIQGGTYYLKDTVVFGLEDSGNNNQTIKYAAYPGEEPVFSSGVKITNWKKLKKYPEALPEKAHGKLWVADVPPCFLACTLLSAVADSKGGSAGTGAKARTGGRFFTLYDSEQRLPRARSQGFTPTPFSTSVEQDRTLETMRDRTTFRFPEGALKNWSNLEDVEILVIPIPWMINILPLGSVDEETGVATLAVQTSYRLGQAREWTESMWVENVIDFLDEPGEWVLNTREKKIYLWPVGDAPGDSIVAPCLKELVRVEGDINPEAPTDIPVRNLTFCGLGFTHGEADRLPENHRGHGLQHDWEMYDRATSLVRLRGAENCTIEECHFFSSGGSAIRLDLYCQKNRIANNLIEHIGNLGILLAGYGPGTKDVNKNNEVYNNHIHHIGEIYWHGHGIMVWQSGNNRIAHNLIHHGPRKAIAVSGVRAYSFNLTDDYHSHSESFETIRWDEVRHVLRGDDWHRFIPFLHSRDNIVEYNEIYRVMGMLGDGAAINVSGAGKGNIVRRNYIHDIYNSHINSSMRTDGWQCGTLFAENIIYNCDCRGMTRKNFNHVENNFIIDVARERTPYVKFGNFPEDTPDYGSRFQRNIFYDPGPEADFYNSPGPSEAVISRPTDCQTDYNLFFSAKDPSCSAQFLQDRQKEGIEQHSISADPLFVDLENGDFRLKPNSPALKLGIKQIDVTKIGLTEDFPERFRKAI